MVRNGIKDFARNRDIDDSVAGNLGVNRCFLFRRQRFFGCLGFCHQHAAVGMRQQRTTCLVNDPAVETLVKIIAA